MVTNSLGWVVGTEGTILKTTDDWQHLYKQTSTIQNSLNALYARDTSKAWVVGDNGAILHTSDGGATWLVQTSGSAESLLAVNFVSDLEGWITGTNGTILQTSDGGKNWKSRSLTSNHHLTSISFADRQYGWIIGGHGLILHTNDGGQSWQTQMDRQSFPDGLFSLFVLDERLCWCLTTRGRLLHTSDGGLTWGIQETSPDYALTDVHFITATSGWLAGGGGFISKTINGGGTVTPIVRIPATPTLLSPFDWMWDAPTEQLLVWSKCGEDVRYQVQVAVTADFLSPIIDTNMLTDTSFVARNLLSDTQYSWHVRTIGLNGQLSEWSTTRYFRTGIAPTAPYLAEPYNGATGLGLPIVLRWFKPWGVDKMHVQVSRSPEMTTDIIVDTLITADSLQIDQLIGDSDYYWHVQSYNSVGVSPFSEIWTFTTAGWLKIASTGSYDLEGLCFIDALAGWCVGEGGTILKTSDGGQSWIMQNSGTAEQLNDVYFANADTGWCAGNSNVLLKTTDGGHNWISMEIPGVDDFWYDLHFINAAEGWVAGWEIFHTADGGTTWTKQNRPPDVYDRINAIFFLDQSYGWAAGLNGTIIATMDGGRTWIRQPTSTYEELLAIHFSDRNSGCAVGQNGVVLMTTDGGTHWHTGISRTTYRLEDVYMVTANTGYAVGAGRTAIITHDGGATWLRQTSETPPFRLTGLSFYGSGQTLHGWICGQAGYVAHKQIISGDPTSVAEKEDLIEAPTEFRLMQNYPNPFNQATVILYTLPQAGHVDLSIYDLLGRKQSTLVSAFQSVGVYRIQFDAGNLKSGVFLYRLTTDQWNETKKFLILK